MSATGIEPALPEGKLIGNQPRLPISPHAHEMMMQCLKWKSQLSSDPQFATNS